MNQTKRWLMIQSLIQKRLEFLEKTAGYLPSNFGRMIRNPLLKGQDISAVIKFSIGYVERSWIMWQEAAKRSKATNREKALFRAATVYVLDMVTDAMDAEDNSPSDMCYAILLKQCLLDILSVIDSLDLSKTESKDDAES